MAQTPNYGLYLSDDASELFLKWREQLCGPNESNMTKIDQALSDKADKSRSVTATLLAASWGDAAPYMQSISVEGMDADTNGTIAIAPGATEEQVRAAMDAVLSVSGQADGAISITASHSKPTMDIPVVIVILD